MKGSLPVNSMIVFVIFLFVAAAAIMIVGSAAENADEPTTGTLSALKNPSLGERLYCKLYCPDPVNDCDVPDSKKEMCTIIAGRPADFTYTGTAPGSPVVSAIVAGSFIPGGTLTVSFPAEVAEQYDLVVDVKIYDGSGNEVADCSDGDTPPDCGFDLQDGAKEVIISLPYERDANHMEQKIKEGISYKILLQASNGDEVYSFNRAWSCPRPQIIEGKYYPEKDVVFTFPTDGTYSWVDLVGYESEKIEIGKRSGGPYDPCDLNSVKTTCNAAVAIVDDNYGFTMPYTEPGEKVAISYPVYAVDPNAPSPMCRSGMEDYVYTCSTTACYTEGAETYIVSSLKDAGAFEANPACKYETKQEQCALGCTMLLSNKAECSLPKPDLITAYMAVKKDGVVGIEKVLNPETGKYELEDELFHVTTGYDLKRVFVAIKNTATEIGGNNEPKLKANNLEVTALLDSVVVAVSPIPIKHYISDENKLADSPDGASELNPGDIFEYEIILDGLFEGIGDIGTHTLIIESSVVGTFESGLPAKFSADTQTSRSYSYTVYSLACKDCSFTTQAPCESCGGRCEWNSVAPSEAACSIK